jgi:SAM-dependent methyltransferase
MCHPSVHEWTRSVLTEERVKGRDVLEAGSFDVNGSVRPHVMSLGPKSYLGTDMREGPGVDRVMTADELPEHFGPEFGLVVSTEMLEHVDNWKSAMSGMIRVVKKEGHLVLTTRSPGFPLHDYPSDNWRYTVEDMKRILEASGLYVDECTADPLPGHPGVFAVAHKPYGWQWQGVMEKWDRIELARPEGWRG